ncbi:MAG: beta-carotene 15,15'-dioxygenase, Brp/Blh family [Wenyingzhuangia sp.]
MNHITPHSEVNYFDLVFVGFGAANCLLLLQLIEKGVLDGKKIGVIEPNKKIENDRTFCFWSTEKELENLNLKELVSHSWNKIKIGGVSEAEINPLNYWHVKGIDLYNLTRKKLLKFKVRFINSYLSKAERIDGTTFKLNTKEGNILARKVFDSRPPEYFKPKNNESHIFQSFFGWKISTRNPCFDPDKIVMMDFNVPQDSFTQFMYVLPFDSKNALIEITRFGSEKISYEKADVILRNYIKPLCQDYKIIEIEKGVIPMSSSKIKSKQFGDNWKNMGARNNKVKCTTGFAFHDMAKEAKLISTHFPNKEIRKKNKPRFAFYDRLLLKILLNNPEKGKAIFELLFLKVKTTTVLNFLQERTSFVEDILLFSKLPKMIFIKTAIKDYIFQIKQGPITTLPLLFTFFSLILYWLELSIVVIGVLIFGFFTIGLAHGALDHIIKLKKISPSSVIKFSVLYLFKAMAYGIIWYFFPEIALLGFIIYSAFHFGQADFKEWQIKNKFSSFIWGFIVLSIILIFHIDETITILSQIPRFSNELIKEINQTNTLILTQFLTLISGVFLGFQYKSKGIAISLIYLILSSFLPLLVGFGIYFTFQHSKNGWKHLKQGLGYSSTKLFLLSVPFSLLAAFSFVLAFFGLNTNQWGIFFIILSCLSLPHVLTMNNFYIQKRK